MSQVDFYEGVAGAAIVVYQLCEPHVAVREPPGVVEGGHGAQLPGLGWTVPALHGRTRPATVGRLKHHTNETSQAMDIWKGKELTIRPVFYEVTGHNQSMKARHW